MTDKGENDRGKGKDASPIIIKKYANRRLYNTATSSYVTLDLLSQMVKDHIDFIVYDAKTGEDITRAVLTQIIVEEEGKGGQNMLPISFLRHVISFYGDSLGGVVPQYLEHSMQSFAHNQEKMRKVMQNALDGLFPVQNMEDLSKQNMAFMESAMKMFSPFDGANMMSGFPAPVVGSRAAGQNKPDSQAATQPNPDDVRAMQRQLAEMQSKLDTLLAEREAGLDKTGPAPARPKSAARSEARSAEAPAAPASCPDKADKRST